MSDKHVDELRKSAEIISSAEKPIIGLCAGGFPITGDACQFCGATWKDKCGRLQAASKSFFHPCASSVLV